MQVEQSGSVKGPITVNERFFEQLKPIIDEFRERTLRAIATRNHMSVHQVKNIQSEGVEPEPKLGYELRTVEELEVERKKLEDWRKKDLVFKEIDQEASLSCSVSYDTGFSTQTNDIDQLRSILASEPGNLESLYFTVGQRYRGTGFRLRLANADEAARFDINGERTEVDHLYRSVMRFLESITPSHAWMHSRNLQAAASLLVGAVVGGSVFILGNKLLGPNAPPVIVLMSAAIVAILSLGSAIGFGALTMRLFPKLESELGPSWHRRKSHRNSLFLLITIIAIPVLINFFI